MPTEARPITYFSIEQIERAFAMSITELTGTGYIVKVNKIDLQDTSMDQLTNSSQIRIELVLTRKRVAL